LSKLDHIILLYSNIFCLQNKGKKQFELFTQVQENVFYKRQETGVAAAAGVRHDQASLKFSRAPCLFGKNDRVRSMKRGVSRARSSCCNDP
jgi:hypothetical protein